MPVPEPVAKRTRSFDGTEIAYHVAGKTGPFMVLVNGLGADTTAWRHQVAYLGDQFRFLSWDYRGLHASHDESEPRPVPGPPVEVHAQDLAAIVSAEGVSGGVWMGWSIGAQVMIEALRRHDVRPDLMILVNPCYGRRSSEVSRLRRLLPHALWTLERAPELVERLMKRAATWPETVSWLKRFGFVAPCIDEDALGEVVRHFRTIHAPAYIDAVRASSHHRIDGMLGAVDVPVLAIVGEKDIVTPRPFAEPLARQIPSVELFVIRGATHYVLLEFPELVNLRVEKFLREHGM
ncbi:MAG: alpha/beta fold hydrolase [Myxococcota bacterium]